MNQDNKKEPGGEVLSLLYNLLGQTSFGCEYSHVICTQSSLNLKNSSKGCA
jgi:hypothetical protein